MKKQAATAEKKKLFHFQFGIRKRMRTDMIVVGSIVAFTLLFSPLIGLANAMTSSMGVITVFISTWYDFTLEPVKNYTMLFSGILGMPLLAFLGYCFFPPGTVGYTVMMTAVTFAVFFAVIYLFTSEEKGNFYMPLLLSFSTMVYTPVYGWELLVREAFCGATILFVIFFQLLLHRNKFQKKIRQELNVVIDLSKKQTTSIMTRESKTVLAAQGKVIEEKLDGITKLIGPKLAHMTRWQAGHDVMRTVHILRRIHVTIFKNFVEGSAVMTQELYGKLEEMFTAIDQFEKDQIPEVEMIRKFDAFFSHVSMDVSGVEMIAALQSELDDFVAESVQHQDAREFYPSVWQRLQDHLNLYNVIFALKTSLVAALGVFVTCCFNIENASMYIMTISVLAQPYVEVGKTKIKLRVIHTLYALAIFLIAFSIPGNLWVHLVILMALIIFGDMLIQFETNVIGSTMIAVVSRVAADPSQMYIMSLYRISYIVAAALVLLLVDVLIFPNRLTSSLGKRLKASVAVNQKLRSVLASPGCTAQQVYSVILEKRRANQRLKHVNQFVQNEEVAAYLLAEEGWLNRLTLLNHRIEITHLSSDALRQLIERTVEAPNLAEQLNVRQKSLLTSLNEVFDEIFLSEQIAQKVSFST